MATQTGAVPRDEVPEAFDEIADRYDLMVGLSPGYHDHLRGSADILVDALSGGRTNNVGARGSAADAGRVCVLDLGCGSGASTRALVDALEDRSISFDVVGVDGSAGMLSQARAKTWPAPVRFVRGRAEELAGRADLLGPEGLDGVFAAYLVRNVTERDALCSVLHDVLAPGGTLVLHEYSVAGNRRARAIWTAVSLGVIVPLGWVISRRTRLYRYLWRSVVDFDSVTELEDRLRAAGFTDVSTSTVSGWQQGIIHTVRAQRPAARP